MCCLVCKDFVELIRSARMVKMSSAFISSLSHFCVRREEGV